MLSKGLTALGCSPLWITALVQWLLKRQHFCYSCFPNKIIGASKAFPIFTYYMPGWYMTAWLLDLSDATLCGLSAVKKWRPQWRLFYYFACFKTYAVIFKNVYGNTDRNVNFWFDWAWFLMTFSWFSETNIWKPPDLRVKEGKRWAEQPNFWVWQAFVRLCN